MNFKGFFPVLEGRGSVAHANRLALSMATGQRLMISLSGHGDKYMHMTACRRENETRLSASNVRSEFYFVWRFVLIPGSWMIQGADSYYLKADLFVRDIVAQGWVKRHLRQLNMMIRLVTVLSVLIFTGAVMATEEAKYRVIEKSGDYELRAYGPRVVAETRVSGPMSEASSAGFRLIADFIFGNNMSSKGNEEKISMTVPVSMEQSDEQWRVRFFMPGQYTLETLPRPINPAVTIREVPAGNYAVVRFSGFANEDTTSGKTASLLAWLDNRGIKPAGKPELARYNPPWTLPFLRRNEVMVAY